MDSEPYLKDDDNIFHQLRGHYLELNKMEHYEFGTFKKPEKEKKKVVSNGVEKKHIQVNILETRMKKLQYIKLRRKGGALEEEEGDQKNLQSANINGYYSIDQLWEKLDANDVSKSDETKMKNWRQLSDDEQKTKIKEFTDRFKEMMEPEVWKELRKQLVKQLLDGDFSNNSTINWHKGTQKILEISGLVINPSCFYWN